MVLDDTSRVSPLARLVAERLGGKTTVYERVVSVTTTIMTLCQNNPNRLAIDIINESAVDARVSTERNITSSSGWLVASSGGYISMVYYDDGEMVGQELFAIAAANGCQVRVREVIRL